MNNPEYSPYNNEREEAGYGYMLIDCNKFDKAIEFFEEKLKEKKDNPYFKLGYAKAVFHKNDGILDVETSSKLIKNLESIAKDINQDNFDTELFKSHKYLGLLYQSLAARLKKNYHEDPKHPKILAQESINAYLNSITSLEQYEILSPFDEDTDTVIRKTQEKIKTLEDTIKSYETKNQLGHNPELN